jgi:deoxyinosine 3'endonuclease (endonuclease V)
MELAMNASQVFPVYMRVDLGRRDIGVAKHLLHGTQVGAALEEMRCERVAKRVR